MVRTYILTQREREILRFHLEHGAKLEGHRELKHALRNLNLNQIKQDLQLIEKFLEKTTN